MPAQQFHKLARASEPHKRRVQAGQSCLHRVSLLRLLLLNIRTDRWLFVKLWMQQEARKRAHAAAAAPA